MLFEGGISKKGGAMDGQPAGRGMPADMTSMAPMPEKLAGVLARIGDKPDDAPVVVSAGFLRWLTKEAGQAERAIEQRDEARVIARQLKARCDMTGKLLDVADKRITVLRGEIAALAGGPIGLEWKFERVTGPQLADYELAGWEPRVIVPGRMGEKAMVALRREAIRKAAAPVEESDHIAGTGKMVGMPAGANGIRPAAQSAAEMEARLPQKQLDMMLAVRDGADIIPRHAPTRRALREAGLIEVVGKPAEWKMRLTDLGAAVLAAYRVRTGTGKKVA